MKRFKPTGWPKAIVSPISSIFSHALDGLSGKDRRRVQILKAALETTEAECDRLRQEMQDLVQYTDGELLKAKQETERVIHERDELQIQILILEEELDAVIAQATLPAEGETDAIQNLQSSSSSSTPDSDINIILPSHSQSPSDLSTPHIDLSNFRLALVGGHPTTRRGVIKELQAHYGLKHFVEIPRMNEVNTTRNRVKSKIYRCNLVVLITGYMSHRLTEIIFSLKDAGALAGEVLQLSCKGKSGVLRGILEHVESSNAY